MKTTNVNQPGEASYAIVRGHTGATMAGPANPVFVPLTNGDAVDLAQGDVVVMQSDGTIIRTTIAQDPRPTGVVGDAIVVGEAGPVQFAGPVDLINVTAAVTAGQYAQTSTTAGKTDATTLRNLISFGYFTSTGTSPSGFLFGGSGSGSAVAAISEDGAAVVASPTAIDLRHGLDAIDAGSGRVAIAVDETELVVRTGALTPAATVTTVKNASNPTSSFAAIPESIVRVGGTYWMVYIDRTDALATVNLASSSSRDGPWTAYGSNPIYTIGAVPWAAGSTGIYAPFILPHDLTFYLFYSVVVTGGATAAGNAIGVASAPAITGPYTDHGSSILAPGAGAAWDSRRVGEADVMYHDGRFEMIYMGETSASAYQTSEKLGTAILVGATPLGSFTKSAANPVLDYTGTETLLADPSLFFANGYVWTMYAYELSGGAADLGLAYSLDIASAFTRYPGNPVLSHGGGGAFDELLAFRGSVFEEDGLYSGVYCGQASGGAFRAGNYRLIVAAPTSSAPSGAAGGDLGGTYPNPTVAKVQGVAVTDASTTGAALIKTGAAAATWQQPSGDLSGTFPGPSVAKIQGVAISGTPSAGQALIASDATHAAWAAVSASTHSESLTDGASNFIFAGGDIVTVVGVPN